MKGKGTSSHHRSENTYRFQTFAERLATVNVDVARRVQKLSATPEDADTFFGQALRKWSELNCTQHFTDFKREISGTVFTFAQLIHHQKRIVSTLLAHLQVPNSLAYQPLLDLVVQVARDLQSDFYVYFEDVLPVLITLLQVHHHTIEVLEQTFTCLSYIFKFLWRAMLSDMKRVYNLISPLLGNDYREYINNFAAESFAFLMRKVKTFPELCEYMFKELETHPDQVSGVGRLLFESVKGVQKQLHSAANKILPVAFEKLAVYTLPLEHVCDCLQYMIDSIAVYTQKNFTEPLWTSLLDHVEAIYKKWNEATKKKKEIRAVQLRLSLQLIHRLISYKNGMLVLPAQRIVKILIAVLEGPTLPMETGEMLLVTVSALAMAEKVMLPLRDQSTMLQLVYTSGYPNHHKVSFTRSVLSLPMFEKDILPPLLVFCTRCLTDEKKEGFQPAIHALAHVISQKAPAPTDGESLDAFSTYLLDFGGISSKNDGAEKMPTQIMKIVEESVESLDGGSLPLLWAAVSLVPHIRPLKGKDCKNILKKVFTSVTMFTKEHPASSDAGCCVVADTVLALMLKLDIKEFYETIEFQDIFNLLSQHPENGHALRTAALYFTNVNKDDTIAELVATEENFIKLLPVIEENLSSPHSKIRILVLEICCQFNLPMPKQEDEDQEVLGHFRICLEAEKVEVGVQTVRTKLMHLRKLDFDILQHQMPIGPYETVALRYLIGMMYVNFTMMWKPTIELIQSHASGLNTKVFWKVFEHYLDKAASKAESLFGKTENKLLPKGKECEESLPSLEGSAKDLKEVFRQHQSVLNPEDRPDYFNFRNLLWEAMQSFPGLCEPRSKIIAPLFFRFLEKEFYPANFSIAPAQNLGKDDMNPKTDDDEDDDEDGEDEDDAEEEQQPEQMNKKKKRPKQRPYNTYLVKHLGLFSKFRNPRNMHGESRLREHYYEFLPHRSPKVQKVALECILTYKDKFLMPYKENLEKLMDDKTFKNEIVLFSVDKENSIIQEEHREGILPVLMAILYGKMQTKTGRDTGGRSHSNVRRSIIFRFLGGCQQHELSIFFDLVFKPFLHYTQGKIADVVTDTIENTNASKVIPLKKQQSVLSTIDVVLLKLGGLVDDYLPSILRIIVGILAQASRLLDFREELFDKAVTWVRSLRLVAIQKLDKFFSTYTSYPFSSEEIDSVFKVAVWPQLERLPKEAVHSPSGLLRLFLTWSQHPRYLNLLQKTWSESSFSVLPMVVQLFNAKAASPKVLEVVMDIVHNLITMHETEEEMEDEEEEPPPVIDVGPVVESEPAEGVPLGVHLMLRHVPAVLCRLKTVVKGMLNYRGRMKILPAKELKVLACLSQYVTDSNQCGEMVSLLLPFLNRNMNRSVEVETSILEATQHLVKRAPKPSVFLRAIARLFSSLSARSSRTALCETLEAIGKCDDSYQSLADVVSKMNSWDRKFIEEPDYLTRIEAFKEAHDLLTSLDGEDYITYVLMFMHNCTFFINTMADMSLRDTSSLCLQKIIVDIAGRPNNMDAVNRIIKSNLIPEVKSGFKQLSEVARHEYITLLSHLVKNFPTIPVLKDMTPLMDQDIEVDFFANMVHIQLHRRGRAMRRISRILGERALMTETMVSFLLPMITAYLRDETYHKEATIMDAVVDTISSMARCLPWYHYLNMLKYYLTQLPRSLDNQKLMVRMIVAILDSFHFDLRNSTEIASTALKAPGVAKEELKPPTAAADGVTPSIGEKPDTETDEQEKAGDLDKSPEEMPEGEKVDDTVTEKDDAEKIKDEVDEDDFTQVGGDLGGESNSSVLGTVTVCSPKLATKIHQTVIKEIIPGLHNSLTRKTKSDDEHKKAKASKFAEDEEVLRVPIALALVKLMQGLPHKTLDFNLPGVLLKVCHFLRSRAIDIRTMARDTLSKIVQSLGPKYFPYVLKELRISLRRGYQYHVLCFTINMLLETLRSSFKSGDLDSSVEGLVAVFNHEIFGDIAEEKEVVGITSKLMEARTTKSFESYAILIKYITKSSLSKIFTPVKSILEASSSHKTARKVEEILRRLVPGLVTNPSLELNDLMTFIYGLTNEVLPLLNPKKSEEKKSVTPKVGQQPTNTYLVQPNPSRTGAKPKTSIKTNMHIIIEFGLQILYTILKQSSLDPKTIEHAKLLDPFVPILTSCLTSKYIKVTSTSLRCVIWVLKFPLPALKKNVKKMSNNLFVLMRTYAVAGAAATGDNFELIDMCFKAVTVLVRDVSYHTIGTDQLKVLLSYAEQDIHDHTRQATAFSLLKAILTRKLVVPEMHDVINKIEELSITAHDGQVRQSCRQVAIKFLLNYPLGARLERHLEFFVAQLEYEHDTGRESALEMLATIFETFPTKLLHDFAAFFFVPLASQIVNDDSAKCRKQAALAMKHLISKLESDTRDQLFAIAVEWFKDDKVALRKIAALTCGVIVEVESTKFERHLGTILPIIEQQTDPTRYNMGDSEGEERELDHLLFGVLTFLSKIMRECNLIRKEKWSTELNTIWGHLEEHLLYPHVWVRLISAQIFGLLFAAWTPKELLNPSKKQAKSKSRLYLQHNAVEKLHDLCGLFCRQLAETQMDQELANQMLKNLVFLGKVLRLLPKPSPSKKAKLGAESNGDASLEQGGENESEVKEKTASLEWLSTRLCGEVYSEIANNPKDTTKRTSVFKWIAAMSLELGEQGLPEYLPKLLPILVREITDKSPNSDENLKKLSQEVVEIMKGVVGVEVFSQHYATLLKTLVEKRQTRKRERATELVANPQLAAQKKLKKNISKLKAKKRRIEELRPVKKAKKHKMATIQDS